jgi:hypothetical protein
MIGYCETAYIEESSALLRLRLARQESEYNAGGVSKKKLAMGPVQQPDDMGREGQMVLATSSSTF